MLHEQKKKKNVKSRSFVSNQNVKVSKSRKQFRVYSILPKNDWIEDTIICFQDYPAFRPLSSDLAHPITLTDLIERNFKGQPECQKSWWVCGGLNLSPLPNTALPSKKGDNNMHCISRKKALYIILIQAPPLG